MFSSLPNSPHYSVTVKGRWPYRPIPNSFLYNIYIMLNWFSSRICMIYFPLGNKQLKNQSIHNFEVGKVFFSFEYFTKIKQNFNTNLNYFFQIFGILVSQRLNIICIKFKIMTWHYLQYFSLSYMWGLPFYSHMENTLLDCIFFAKRGGLG
jgi:hypothetical protein